MVIQGALFGVDVYGIFWFPVRLCDCYPRRCQPTFRKLHGMVIWPIMMLLVNHAVCVSCNSGLRRLREMGRRVCDDWHGHGDVDECDDWHCHGDVDMSPGSFLMEQERLGRALRTLMHCFREVELVGSLRQWRLATTAEGGRRRLQGALKRMEKSSHSERRAYRGHKEQSVTAPKKSIDNCSRDACECEPLSQRSRTRLGSV